MFKSIRHMLFGLNKQEEKELLDKKILEQRIRFEQETREKKLREDLEKSEAEYELKRNEFYEGYIRDLQHKIDIGYWAEGLEGGEWKKWGGLLPKAPYIFWDAEKLQSIHDLEEKILNIKKQLNLKSESAVIESPVFTQEESLYREILEKQRKFCLEHYGKDQFSLWELGIAEYTKKFDDILKKEPWASVLNRYKQFNSEIELYMQEYRSKAIELDKMVDEPPVIRLSLYEKYDYFMQKADENPDQILDAIIKEYESSDYYYTKTQKALKYKSPFIDLYKAGRDHWLRDSYWALTGRPLPVFREGLIEPVWAEYGSDIYKAYNEVPAFDDVFQYFPYNTVAGNNLPDDCYAAGRLLLARLYHYYVQHPDHAFYGLLYKKLVCAAADAAKKARGQYLNEKKGIIVGVEGEMLVRSELNKFDDLAIHLYNIRFEFEGNSIENDCITITPYGVFSIEVKNFGSEGQYDLQIAEDGQWRKISAERKIDEQLPNTFTQVMNHVNGTRRMLKARLQEKPESSLSNKEILVKPIVIISNEQVQIDNASGQVILRPSGVYNYIFNSPEGNACYTREEMKEIEQILLQSKLPDNKYPMVDYHKMIERIQEVFEIDNELPRRIYRLEKEIKNLFDESSENIEPASKYDDAFAEMFFAMFYRPEHSDSKPDDENR